MTQLLYWCSASVLRNLSQLYMSLSLLAVQTPPMPSTPNGHRQCIDKARNSTQRLPQHFIDCSVNL